MSRHSSITQDWMGWNVGLFPRACHHPCSGTWGYHFPLETSLYIPHTEKAEFCLCYLITSMRSQLLPMVRFSRDSGNFCVQVIGMQNEMNQKRHLPIQTQMTRDTRQMTNSHRKKRALQRSTRVHLEVLANEFNENKRWKRLQQFNFYFVNCETA